MTKNPPRSRENLLKLLQATAAETGKVPTDAAMRKLVSNHRIWKKLFGSWNGALREAGLAVHLNRDPLPPRICEFCKTPLPESAYRGARFCDRSCANRARNKGKTPPRSGMSRAEYLVARRAESLSRLLNTDFNVLGKDNRRRRVILEQKGACARCGISKWQGEPLTLELDHIDGNNANDARSNLECLCPNCHSLTPTWRGRNKQAQVYQPIDIDAVQLLVSGGKSLSQALKELGRCGKGAVHRRISLKLAANNALSSRSAPDRGGESK